MRVKAQSEISPDMRLIIVSGLSGSGKSVALHALEDIGFYCIDNVPATLLGNLITQVIAARDSLYDNIAVGVDARNRASDLESLPELLHSLKDQGVRYEIIFLHAENQTLLGRYRETRRKHPLRTENMSLLDAIESERKLLGPITYSADLVIDTTKISNYELAALLRSRLGGNDNNHGALSIQLESFGFKHGVPYDADFVFDVRCLPNPYWDQNLRALNGKDPAVIKFLEQHTITATMLNDIVTFLKNRIPEYVAQNRNFLTIAIGCTGGQHRSVYLVERIAEQLKTVNKNILIQHTELPSAVTPSGAPAITA